MAINYGKLNAKLTPRGSLKATMGVSGPLNSDYEALINKPQINGNELIGNKTNADLGIPTALEDLTDDSTHRVVTDEQISTWDNKSDFSGSYNDLTDKPTIPDELADLTDDSTHRLVTDTEKTTWDAKSDFSGSYNDLTDVPANLVQDANYVHTDNNYDNTAKGKVNALGTASTKNIPVSGDASTSEVVLGNDTRLTDDRNAKDVYFWAKASTKPSYTATEVGAIASTLKGTANGVAELDANGKVPSAQLPSYVDDVLEYASTSAFPQTGESGKIYIALDTNKTYRWGGSAYVEISESLALGETDSTAYAGNKGKQNADNIATIQGLIPSSATTSNKLATANDIPDISGKADKSEMSVSTSNDLTTIQLKSGTSATVINAHQDISGKANKSEMSVSTNGDKTTIQLKSGTSAEVLNQHQDISGKVDKVEGKGLSTNDYDDTAKGIVDGVTSALADKVDKVNGKGLSTEDYTTAEKTKLGAISDEANKVTSSSTNGHINIDGVDTIVYDDTSVQSDIDAIENELSTDSATVEGNPINFSTLSAQNATSTLIDLEPIQDLHGYDKPWIGGAGKNKLGLIFTEEPTKVSGLDFTHTTSSFTLSGTSNSEGFRIIGLQDSSNIKLNTQYRFTAFIDSGNLNGMYITLQLKKNGTQIERYTLTSQNLSATFTQNESYDAINFILEGIPANTQYNLKVSLQLEEGSTATPYEPYENICPISGRTEIGILGCGKNLFNPNDVGIQDAYLKDDGTTTTSEVSWKVTDYISVIPNSVMTFSFNATEIANSPSICWYDKDKNFLGGKKYANQKIATFALPNNAVYVRASYYWQTWSDNAQLEYGYSRTTYEPYIQSNDITIQFGQTVYGVQLDVEKGVLVVDKKAVDLGSLDWIADDFYKTSSLASEIKIPTAQNPYVGLISSILQENSVSNIYNNEDGIGVRYSTVPGEIRLRYTGMPTVVSDFVASVTGQTLCYPLATPITIQLTPNTINLLKGVNNISTDGDNITLTYRDGSVATLGDLTSAVDNLDSKIDESKILTDTVTGDKYILVVSNGVLDIQQVSN